MIIASDIHFGRTPEGALAALDVACREDAQRVLILAGDLTDHGKEGQFAGMASFLGGIIAQGVRVVCCPGNHDLSYLFGYAPSPGGARRDRYLDHLTGLLTSQPDNLDFTRYDAVLRAGEDVIVSLRSVHRRGRLLLGNRVEKTQLRWARGVLDRHGITGRDERVHFVTHYSLWSLFKDRHRNLHRRGRLERDLLRPYQVRTYINGHNHRFTAARRGTPKLGHDLYHIQAPSLTRPRGSGPRGFISWDPGSGRDALLVAA